MYSLMQVFKLFSTADAHSEQMRRYYPGKRKCNEESEPQVESLDAYEPTNLKLLIILSGKRKTGKDHISTILTNYVGYHRMRHLAILRIAGPIKREFARDNKLDLVRLLDATGYKEDFRMEMTRWAEDIRQKEGWNTFLKQTIKEQRAKDKAIWILNDARRPSDIEFFDADPSFANTKIIKLRIEATEEARMSRGWKFVEGIDDRDSECGLDNYDNWTLVVRNDYNDQRHIVMEELKPVFEEIDSTLRDIDEEPLQSSSEIQRLSN